MSSAAELMVWYSSGANSKSDQLLPNGLVLVDPSLQKASKLAFSLSNVCKAQSSFALQLAPLAFLSLSS